MDQFNISKWNRSRYLAETREGTSKSTQLTGLINKALDQVDEFLNVEDFASSVANILKEEYGSHLFNKFMGKLHAELGMDVSEGINEASLSKIYNAARKGSYPITLVAIENGKVVDQKLVGTPEIVPAAFNDMQKEFPKAQVNVEDRKGKILFNEANLGEDYSTMQLKSNIDQKWKNADDMYEDMLQWVESVYIASGVEAVEPIEDAVELLLKFGIKASMNTDKAQQGYNDRMRSKFSEGYTSEWDPETAAKNLRVAKGIEPKYTTYTKGEKVTYLGHPAVITGVKEYNGKIYYSVSYDKGNGKTKASNILSTDGTITEGAINEKSSLFSQSLVDDVEKKIREITGILEDGYNENVEYREYKFKDGTGGFTFKWSHARNWGGRLGLSLSENGNHTIETLSYYDDGVFSNKAKFKSDGPIEIQTWKDLSDDDLFNIFRILQPSLKKNETLAKKALSDEASAQSDYYANKPDTGRIGYGLSQQPRIREEKENVDLFLRYRDDSSGRLYTAEFKGKNVGLKGANKLLKYYGIDMEVPPQYDEDILDQIVAALKEKNVSAYHIDNKDV